MVYFLILFVTLLIAPLSLASHDLQNTNKIPSAKPFSSILPFDIWDKIFQLIEGDQNTSKEIQMLPRFLCHEGDQLYREKTRSLKLRLSTESKSIEGISPLFPYLKHLQIVPFGEKITNHPFDLSYFASPLSLCHLMIEGYLPQDLEKFTQLDSIRIRLNGFPRNQTINFMNSIAKLEAYLLKGPPLTCLQVEFPTIQYVRPPYLISACRHLSHLQSLTYYVNEGPYSLSPLTGLSHLTSLALLELPQDPINILGKGKLLALEKLTLKETWISTSTLRLLTKLPHLKSLCFITVSLLRNIDVHDETIHLLQLKSLDMPTGSEYDIINWILHLTNLESLNLPNSDIHPTQIIKLSHLKNLKYLNLHFAINYYKKRLSHPSLEFFSSQDIGKFIDDVKRIQEEDEDNI